MSSTIKVLGSTNRAIAYALGLGVVTIAISTAYGGYTVNEIRAWALKVFGVSFLVLFSTLVLAVLVCWNRLPLFPDSTKRRQVWFEGGLQAAGGISTLALTFTLLGISMGIGTLADQPLTPETVPTIISELTRHFSMAFMTTVVGLPVSAALRALLIVTERKIEAQP